ncbi:MAG: glycosyltransferase [Actinomycetota bacterium]|nr:glycosyltransferase [Actinomycetota bacterium]
MSRTVLVVSARIGAGHDGAATELCRRLEARGMNTVMVDFLDAAPHSGSLTQRVFQLWLRWTPWAYEIAYRLWVAVPILYAPMSGLLAAVFGKRLQRWATQNNAVAVVSTYPFASVVLGRLRSKNRIAIPVATFMTDFSVHPLWLGRGMDLHLCVHPITAAIARNKTAEPTLAPGPMVAPQFRENVPCKQEVRLEMGIPEDRTVVLITAGSWGVGQIEATFDDIAGSDRRYFVLVACGKNEKLQRRLSERSHGRGLVVGWTDQMPQLMVAADALVQNAGGLTSMEAFAIGLPVITYRPIPGHGRDNARAMEQAGVAPYARNPTQLRAALDLATSGIALHATRAKSIFKADAAEHVADLARSNLALEASSFCDENTSSDAVLASSGSYTTASS